MHFPNESTTYRQARNQLLEAEQSLVQQVEKVAAMRRQLPPGGVIAQDYLFEGLDDTGASSQIALSSLFRRHSAVVLYSFMFSAEMSQACPMCSSFIDGLNGNAPHLVDRLELAIVAKSPLERLLQFGCQRGWKHLRLLSSYANSYNLDYHGEGLWQGRPSQNPMLNVFVQREGEIRHFWASELQGAEGPGDPRHLDIAWPLWNVLDMTPQGRGDGYPRLSYP